MEIILYFIAAAIIVFIFNAISFNANSNKNVEDSLPPPPDLKDLITDNSQENRVIGNDRKMSLVRLAFDANSSPDEIKDKFLLQIFRDGEDISEEEYIKMKGLFSIKKQEEAEQYKIDPEDTPSALMEEWVDEYREKQRIGYLERKEWETIDDFMSKNPDFGDIVRSGDEKKIKEFISNNPDTSNSFIEELAYLDKPAEKYRHKAIEKLPNDNKAAINLINKGLEFDEPETEPLLYYLRSECHFAECSYEKAVIDINQALKSLRTNLPERRDLFEDYTEFAHKIDKKISENRHPNKDVT